MPGLRRLRTALAAAVILASQAAGATETDDAVAVVAGLHAALVEVAAMDPAPDLADRIRLLGPAIAQSHDLARMGRVTVRRYWRDWSDAEFQEFLDAFERLSVATYASRFATIGPDVFGILGATMPDESTVDVDAVIRRPDGEPVSMEYSLKFDGEHWRIVNVLADGVSELNLMASDFYAILEAGSQSDLIAELQSRIDAL